MFLKVLIFFFFSSFFTDVSFLWPCSGHNSDSQNALEDLTHLEFLAHLRKTPTSAAIFDHLSHNGVAAAYGGGAAQHDDLPPAIWSPGAQRRSPERGGERVGGVRKLMMNH